MALLSEEEIREGLAGLPHWERDGREIHRNFAFDSFASAIQFVDRVAQLANQADHHPDIDIRYDKVRLSLSTHSAGGLTKRDMKLAAKIDELR
ncbi:MAG: 4a-hydroxytetrahydrobiopterin dehydratase [Longimicrobiales bacterium]